jgi:hypothetical protein
MSKKVAFPHRAALTERVGRQGSMNAAGASADRLRGTLLRHGTCGKYRRGYFRYGNLLAKARQLATIKIKAPTKNSGVGKHLKEIIMARILLAALTAMILSILVALPTDSVAQKVPDLPVAVICWSESAQLWRVGYLAQANKDGTAIYLTPGGQLSATVNVGGLVETPQDRGGTVDCYGKAIDELRAMGRAVEFQRPR